MRPYESYTEEELNDDIEEVRGEVLDLENVLSSQKNLSHELHLELEEELQFYLNRLSALELELKHRKEK